MNKEPMIFAVAGMIFGFVLGYMAAGFVGDHADAPGRAPPPGVTLAAGEGAAAAATRSAPDAGPRADGGGRLDPRRGAGPGVARRA